jgi:hypothetical protein
MAKINLNSILADDKNAVERIEETVEVAQQPLPDFDAILLEWSYRCDKGYPDLNNKKDMAILQNILFEMGIKNPFNLTEAPDDALEDDPELVFVTGADIFTKEYLDSVYPKHSRAIMDAYRKFGKSKNLSTFGTITTIADLLTNIGKNISDPLYKELYTISSVSGKEGEAADTSGRGGLGKGEVLCVLLTKGGKSGGTSGTDLDSIDGSVTAEVKAGHATNFKVPLAASRITKFESQLQLRKLYSIVEDVKDMDEWTQFLKDIQNELGADAMELQDGLYFGKKPTPANINFTEYRNLRKFFKGCYSYFYKSKNSTDDSVYIDIDSATGQDALLQAKLKSPSSVNAIKPNSKVELDVITKDEDNIRIFKLFESKLKNHLFVSNPNAFDTVSETDLKGLLKNKYIVFHESTKGVLPKPILIADTGGTYKPEIIGYTLDSAIIKFYP